MKTAKWLLLTFLTSLVIQAKTQTLTSEQLQSDFTLFRTALKEVHPEMYRYTSRQTFDSLFAATQTRLNQPLTQHEFYRVMLPLLVALHDGHIKWIPSGRDEHYPFFTEQLFPLKLYFLGERAWIVGNYGKDSLPEGAEIISINSVPIDSVIQTLLPHMTFADGCTNTGKYQDLNHFFSGYYATHFGAYDQFEVAYRQGSEEKIATLDAVSEQVIKDYIKKHQPAHQPPYRLTFTDHKTAVMTIERFWDEKQDYKEFLKDTFRQLKEQEIQHLILDLRNNEGGNEAYGVWLYAYLAKSPFQYYDYISVSPEKDLSFSAWKPKFYKIMRALYVRKTDQGYVFTKQAGLKEVKPKRDAFQGEVYVLINGSSFSVTTEFAARMHADRRAVFIGQETGGGYEGNSSGVFTIVQLPHAKMDVGIPMLGFHMANLPADLKAGQGITPDHQVVPTAEDIVHNLDPVMEYTFQLIQTHHQSNADLKP